jgi:putative hydrolase of the HAD superfamily
MPARPPIRAVLLDAMGTLLNLEPPWPLLVAELAARGTTITEEQARTALRAEIAYYRLHHDEASDGDRLSQLRDRCTEVLAEHLPASARGIPDLRGALLASLRFVPYPEAIEVLTELRASGLRLVVVSNWDVSLHEALDGTGLAALVDGAISSAEVGASKPDPAIFAVALGLAGVGAEAAVHVGDSLEMDVRGAQRSGIRPVLVSRDGGGEDARALAPDIVQVSDLRGLPGPPVYLASR